MVRKLLDLRERKVAEAIGVCAPLSGRNHSGNPCMPPIVRGKKRWLLHGRAESLIRN